MQGISVCEGFQLKVSCQLDNLKQSIIRGSKYLSQDIINRAIETRNFCSDL